MPSLFRVIGDGYCKCRRCGDIVDIDDLQHDQIKSNESDKMTPEERRCSRP
mgnify:CR=1 FL=1